MTTLPGQFASVLCLQSISGPQYGDGQAVFKRLFFCSPAADFWVWRQPSHRLAFVHSCVQGLDKAGSPPLQLI